MRDRESYEYFKYHSRAFRGFAAFFVGVCVGNANDKNVAGLMFGVAAVAYVLSLFSDYFAARYREDGADETTD